MRARSDDDLLQKVETARQLAVEAETHHSALDDAYCRQEDPEWERWRQELLDKLEAIHMRAVEADAFHSAVEAVYNETEWPSDGDPERRRARNRLACFSEELSRRLDALLCESREAVELAMRRAR